MLCPACVEPMEPLVFFNVEIDSCRFCGGVWLDPGELTAYIRQGTVPGRILTGYCLDDSRMKVDQGERKCPKCNETLKVTKHKDVNVDICPGCRGLWFDRGEILEIMKAYYQEGGAGGRSYSQPVRTTLDDEGDEIIKICDSDLDKLMDNDSPGPEQLTDVEREFLSSGGKDAVIKAIPRTLQDKMKKKTIGLTPAVGSPSASPLMRNVSGGFMGDNLTSTKGGLMTAAILAFADAVFGNDSF